MVHIVVKVTPCIRMVRSQREGGKGGRGEGGQREGKGEGRGGEGRGEFNLVRWSPLESRRPTQRETTMHHNSPHC